MNSLCRNCPDRSGEICALPTAMERANVISPLVVGYFALAGATIIDNLTSGRSGNIDDAIQLIDDLKSPLRDQINEVSACIRAHDMDATLFDAPFGTAE